MDCTVKVIENLIEELKKESKNKKTQKETINQELKVADAYVDELDCWIQKIDKEIPILTGQINDAIQKVKEAYDARIAIGCSSGLAWTLVQDNYYVGDFAVLSFNIWEVQENAETSVNSPLYGAKYYRKPLNRDYGTNVLREISGSIGLGETILSVISVGGTDGVQVGDYIADSLSSPTLFSNNSLPKIVGFGSTTYNFYDKIIGGNVSTGSTIFTHVGIGSTIGISTGNIFYSEGYTTPSTTVVGFGTTTVNLQVINYTSGVPVITAISTTVNTIILSNASLGIGTNIEFNVGVASTVPSLILSTTATQTVDDTEFTVLRLNEDADTDFDYTKNPLSPITVGIINSSNVGLGHTLELVNNGHPSKPKQWNVGLDEAPPNVGAGKVTYNKGTLSWPVIISCTGTEPNYVCIASTAPLGTVAVANTSTSIGTTSTSPTGLTPTSPVCVSYASSIAQAELNLEQIKSKNLPKIDNLIKSSMALRRIRDEKELYAWSLLQGSSYINDEYKKIEEELNSLINTDFTSFES